MKKYPKYKDSGVEWIGEIPQGWMVKKNKFFLSSFDERSSDGSEELLSVSEHRGIVPRKSIKTDEDVLTRAESLEGYRKVKIGSLVSNIMLTWKRGLGVSDLNGIVSPAYSVFDFIESTPKYFHYLFRTDQYTSEFKRNSTGVIESRLRMYDDTFLRLKSHFPPLSEQQQIVTYLDHKTTLIDQIISGSENKIELLKEQRTANINHAVTKGLNPKVKMKDSGVEWIGEIPEGWEVKKLKHLTDYKNGAAFKSDDFSDESEIPVIRIGDVSDNINFLECAKVPISFLKTYSDFVIQKESILIGLTGGTIGKSCHFKSDVSCLLNQRVCSLVNNENLNNKLLYYYVKSQVFITYIFYNCYGGGQDNIGKSDIINMIFPLPPQQEQQQIVNFLDQKTKEIDDLISSEQKRIELMKEYRQSMISEVVTGKIKVTNH